MQFFGQGKPPVGVVFDSDMGNNIGAALALALLYGLDGKNEARVVSVSVSKSNLNSAAFSEAIGRFYAGPVSGAFGGFGRTLPIGMSVEGKMPEDTPMLTQTLAKQKPDGTQLYAHNIHQLNDTADPAALIRNAFTAQHDQNAMVILAGPATNLVKAFSLPGVKELAGRKLRCVAFAAGAFPDGKPEFNITADIPAARKLFEECPVEIIAAGAEIGEALPYPGSSIETDFAWSPAHPVADAYRAFHTMPYDAPASAMAAVLYAIRPKEGYFKLSEPGTISVLEDGRTKFTPSADGKHRHLIYDPTQKERILKAYTEIASAKPVVKPRFRPKKADDAKPDEKPAAKPEDKKDPPVL